MPSRIEREVEELLESLDAKVPKRPLSSRLKGAAAAPFRAIGSGLGSIPLPHITAGHVLLAAIAVIVVAYVVGGAEDAWRWVLAAGIIMFIGAFVWSLRRQSRPPEKYWRDKPLELRQRSSWWSNWRNRRR
jgi:hypothetical protein